MNAVVLPFPATRRLTLIHSIARRALELNPTAGEQHIRHSLKLQATVMRRRGIAESLIAVEIRGLETAVRSQIWHTVMRSAR